MPDPPSVNVFTRFVLEDPWPLAGLLLGVAAVLLWIGLRDGRMSRLRVAGVLTVIAAIILAIGWSVTTSGEHAEAVTEQFVERAVAGDVNGALALCTDSVTLAVGSPRNEGYPLSYLRSRLHQLPADRIEGNRITTLRGYSVSADEAIVHLSCSTRFSGGYGSTPTQWLLEIDADDDDNGSWKISRIVWISVNFKKPSASLLR